MSLHYSSRNALEKNEGHSNAVAPGWTLSSMHTYKNGILYYGNGSKEAIGATYIADKEQYIVYAKDDVSYLFDSEGRHLQSSKTLSKQTISTFAYNDTGRIASLTDRFTNVTEIIYDEHDNISKIVAPTGQVTILNFDPSGTLQSISYADGSSYTFVYDERALMLEESEPNGNTFKHRFNQEGKIVEIVDAEDGIWSFNTQTEGAMTQSSMTLAEGDTMVFTNYPPENNGQRSVIKRPNGEEVVVITSADRSQKTRTECGVTRIENLGTDPLTDNDALTSVKTVQPSGLTSETTYNIDYTYNGDGAVIGKKVQTSKNGSTTAFYEDLQAQTKSLTTPLGKHTRVNFDAVTGLPSNIQSSGLEEQHYTYDAQGRVTEVSQGERVAKYSYDTHGNLVSLTDPSNKTTLFSYDQRGRVVETTYADGHTSSFSYDANGNMLRLTTPTPADFEFTYNGVNKMISAISPLKKTTQYLYDKQRRLIQTIRPSGNSVNHSYVNGERIQTVTPERIYNYTYDCGGKIASIQSDAAQVNYTYDGDLITQMDYTGILNASIGYTYNNFFQPNSVSYADNLHVLNYDADNLLIQSGNAIIGRNVESGLIESISDANYAQTMANNSYGELGSSILKVNGKEIFSYTVDERNAKGQILKKTERSGKKEKTYSYTYDDVGRLLAVFQKNKLIESYTYDANGNRIHKEGYGLVPHPGKHLGVNVEKSNRQDRDKHYNKNAKKSKKEGHCDDKDHGTHGKKHKGQGHDHLDEFKVKRVNIDSIYTVEDQLEKVGDTLYAYNEDGYLSSKVTPRGTTEYHYGTLGELRSVVLEDATVIEYLHNANNQRVAKKVNGIITEKYLWQDLTTLLAVYDGNDNLIQRFEYAGQRTPYAMIYNGKRYYLAYDQVGTLKAVAKENGRIVKAIVSDTFGNVWKDSNPEMKIPFGFAGGLYDEDTRLTRFGYRDYDAETGKWTAKDPIGFDGGDTNLYGYVLNDPVNFVDPTGEVPISGSGGVGAGMHALIAGLNGHIQVKTIDGNIYYVITVCGRIGLGIYLGAGAEVGSAIESECQTDGWSGGVGADVAFGTLGGSVGAQTNGSNGALTVDARIPLSSLGIGASGGVDGCYTWIIPAGSFI
jgi:RHS repeat-associated protein